MAVTFFWNSVPNHLPLFTCTVFVGLVLSHRTLVLVQVSICMKCHLVSGWKLSQQDNGSVGVLLRGKSKVAKQSIAFLHSIFCKSAFALVRSILFDTFVHFAQGAMRVQIAPKFPYWGVHSRSRDRCLGLPN